MSDLAERLVRSRVTFTAGTISKIVTAKRRYVCSSHLSERHYIEPGQRYVRNSLPPFNPEIGNDEWQWLRLCFDCCPQEHDERDFAAGGVSVSRLAPIMDRLWVNLEWHGDCLLFMGGVNKSGYGLLSERVNGRHTGHATHRLVYARTIGEIPDGLYVLHSCDNRRCCNPDHLRVGTHADNMRDAAERDRFNNGRSSYTHCPAGHAYDDENTYRAPGSSSRSCRACHRERERQRRAGEHGARVRHLRAAARQIRNDRGGMVSKSTQDGKRWLPIADWLDTAGADLWAHGPLCCDDGCDECDDSLWMPHVRRALTVANAYLTTTPASLAGRDEETK